MLMPPFIDVEASGFGRGSYPLEIGLALSDGRSMCRLIRPLEGWIHWDEKAEQLHGISRELVMASGFEAGDVAQWLNTELAGQVVYTDAWGNDNSWVARLFSEMGLIPRFRLETLRLLLSEEQALLWHDVKAKVISEQRFKRHRASYDARILQLSYLNIMALTTDSDLSVKRW